MVIFVVTGLIAIASIATGTAISKAVGACHPKQESIQSNLDETQPEGQVSDVVSPPLPPPPPRSVTNHTHGATLRNVAVEVFRHINVGEAKLVNDKKLCCSGERCSIAQHGLEAKMAEAFDEKHFVTPVLRQKRQVREFWCPPPRITCTSTEKRSSFRPLSMDDDEEPIPLQPLTVDAVEEFLGRVFDLPKVTRGCSSVVLLYVERLIETAHVPLVASTWKPVLVGALVQACKVAHNRANWEAEFRSVYPEYSEESIWTIQMVFLGAMEPEISAVDVLYEKFYSGLESLVDDEDVVRSRSQMIGVVASFRAGREEISKREVRRMRSELRMSSRGR